MGNMDIQKTLSEKIKEKLEIYDFATYDFTEDWKGLYEEKISDEENKAHKKYKELPVMKKYFTYKISKNDINGYYPLARMFKNRVKQKYSKYIPDPDTYSPLLQEIYKNLWSKNVLDYCRETKNKTKEEIIHGDTMNSIQTTLGWYTRDCYDKNYNYYGAVLNEGENNGFVNYEGSLSQALEIYCREQEFFIPAENDDLIKFIKCNHTLGNFIPVPFKSGGRNFNSARYNATNDFWDLTLYYIYCWYNPEEKKNLEKDDSNEVKVCDCEKNEDLYKLLGENSKNVERCIEWLKAFGSWNEFVEKNFLQPFVYKFECESDNAEEKVYGIPKMLWRNDDKGYKYPNDPKSKKELNEINEKEKALWEKRILNNKCANEDVCEQYFKNATTCIKARTQLIINAIIKETMKNPALKWEKLEKWIMDNA